MGERPAEVMGDAIKYYMGKQIMSEAEIARRIIAYMRRRGFRVVGPGPMDGWTDGQKESMRRAEAWRGRRPRPDHGEGP